MVGTKNRFSWRKEGEGPARRYYLYYGGQRVATVGLSGGGNATYWYSVPRTGRNSLLAGETFDTLDVAKRACREWVRSEMRAGRWV